MCYFIKKYPKDLHQSRLIISNTLIQRIYQIVFWIGYLSVLSTSFIPVRGNFNEKIIGVESIYIRTDYLLHSLVYFLICYYFSLGLKYGLYLFKANSIKKFIILIILLAVVTELIQLWAPERAFNIYDMIANLFGIIVGISILQINYRKNEKTYCKN
jgi:hypothetical protein